ncbi:uncharacterized protein SCHCODRAFT_02712282 [Schizophyllum commune H4-8]|uniref:uncharacterized protein n=1 Tax=Schizophyllum commune (strain H4-8 / FGSC 9210) TaxID=578458 RepID=UPI00215E3923|nr:uncharacterized protein SCHCODRAFT_02712282 [Schizophyllum commune H4-8]KAI5888421.1 hypothetical protein SCHCODRAFT_02712282 [Schizophyllum commune H4-8]
MVIGHLVATFPTDYKTITTMVCCNRRCNKSLRLQLHYWPVGHCREGRRHRRRRRNPAATIRDALIVVVPSPAPRRAATCLPPHPPILPTQLPPRCALTSPFPRSAPRADGRARSPSRSHVLP